MMTIQGFVGGAIAAVITWFVTNYWGRGLLRFWDLRLKAHEVMFLYANVCADHPTDLGRAKEGSCSFGHLARRSMGLEPFYPCP